MSRELRLAFANKTRTLVLVNAKREQNFPFSVNHDLTGATLKKWREERRLNQDEAGQLLGVSREWLGKLERGEKPISSDIYLRFEALKREQGFTFDVTSESPTNIAAEHAAAYGTEESIRREIRSALETTLQYAGDDRDRLGWVKVQLAAHLTPPANWQTNDEANRVAIELARRARESRAAKSEDGAVGAGAA